MRGHENHVFNDEPLYEQVHTGMVFITRDGGHVVRVTRVNKQLTFAHCRIDIYTTRTVDRSGLLVDMEITRPVTPVCWSSEGGVHATSSTHGVYAVPGLTRYIRQNTASAAIFAR